MSDKASSKIEKFIAFLKQEVQKQELELTGTEVADILWLAKQRLTKIETTSKSGENVTFDTLTASAPEQTTKAVNEPSQTVSNSNSGAQTAPTDTKQPAKVGVYTKSTSSKSLAIKLPDAPGLPQPLKLARALRPLNQKINSVTEVILDEEATANRIAEERVNAPVFQPALEPAFDLILVVDESSTMIFWQKTIQELQKLLEIQGAFRDVQVWGLLTNENGGIYLRRGTGKTSRKHRHYQPRFLVDPSGKRLFLVASDCVADIWRNGKAFSMLKIWAPTNIVAIIQMLPQWLWERTALNLGAKVQFASLTPRVANQNLLIKRILLWNNVDFATGTKIPIFTLEENSAKTWSKMIALKSGACVTGFVLPSNFTPFEEKHQTLPPEEIVSNFRRTATPIARKLASLLSAAPVITLPIVRIIQKEILKDESQQVHVAEVFLGGILKRKEENTPETNPDEIEFDFLNEEIRDSFFQKSSITESLEIIDTISQYIATKINKTTTEFNALLRKPEETLTGGIDIKPFALLKAKVLKRLGGNYVQFAEEMEQTWNSYYQVEDPKETELLYEAKLLIIGEGGAGKTTLAKKIEDENYKLDSSEKSTEGINVIQWKFLLDNGHEFRVNIWDFGGQEIYHQTHQFFLTQRSLYILVVDTRQENIDCYWWLKVVELLSGSSPILIIKNEKQDRKIELNGKQLCENFANLKEVLPTNLATNRGLSEIKEKIKSYISNLSLVGAESPLPKLWVRVRSALENYAQNRNYIELNEYFQLCKTNQLTDRRDMLRLSRYLHDLGVCLHFQDDSRLKHYVILRPEWGTNAVYKILDNKTVKQNLGCFNQENLADIWQDDEYNNMRDELLQLMMRFKLCYSIPNRPGNYIAPQLLDIEQPEYSWDKSHNLILWYKYEFMPKGILIRLIVETYPWIENQKLAWKNGVVLNKDETRAEIIENYNQKEIKVSLSGNRKKELLAVVTHELEKIHQSFEHLQYKTLVPCNCTECTVSENPYAYELDSLRKRLKGGKYQVECERSYEFVDVRTLIDDVNS